MIDLPDGRLIAIRKGPQRGGLQKKYFLTPRHETLLRERYDSQTQTITDLADVFGVPRWQVRKWAALLGLSRSYDHRPWTREAEEYLSTWWHRRNAEVIARKLGRTLTAVSLKAKRLGLRKHGEGYTMRQMEVALGEDHHKIQRWMSNGWLEGSRRQTLRTEANGGDTWLFTDIAIQAFIRNHPMEISLKKVDQLWFMDLMLGGF